MITEQGINQPHSKQGLAGSRALPRTGLCFRYAMAIGLLGGAGVLAQDRVSPDRIRAELAELGIVTQPNMNGTTARAVTKLDDKGLLRLGPLLASLGDVRTLNLSECGTAQRGSPAASESHQVDSEVALDGTRKHRMQIPPASR